MKEYYCLDFEAPEKVEKYHKHSCLAVLVIGDNYDKGLKQLLKWIKNIESKHKVEVVDRDNGHSDMLQIMFHGVTTPTLKLKE
jgi:hypothetical protein